MAKKKPFRRSIFLRGRRALPCFLVFTSYTRVGCDMDVLQEVIDECRNEMPLATYKRLMDTVKDVPAFYRVRCVHVFSNSCLSTYPSECIMQAINVGTPDVYRMLQKGYIPEDLLRVEPPIIVNARGHNNQQCIVIVSIQPNTTMTISSSGGDETGANRVRGGIFTTPINLADVIGSMQRAPLEMRAFTSSDLPPSTSSC